MIGESEKRAAEFGKTLIDLAVPRNQDINVQSQGDISNVPPLPPHDGASGDQAITELSRLGDYQILSQLGEGGMGAVYLGYQVNEKKHVAIKVLSSQHTGNQEAIDRFYREVKSGTLLKHPNIVRNLTAGQDQLTGLHYLVMEYVEGPSLEAVLDKFGKLSVGDAVHIVLDIARGLEHVHSRNMVHRDIKPGNILLTQSGLAKLSDLGLAKRLDEASYLTAAKQGFGTPYYMPYEQAVNAKAADARSDIYALGATFYHLIVGEVPFTGTDPMEIIEKKKVGDYTPASVANPEIPKILDTFLARMLAREPRHRYQTASDLIVDLERSQLAAAVPSFVDPKRALYDPVVRQQIKSSMQTTAMQVPAGEDTPVHARFWFIRFRDKLGHWRKAKMTVTQILRRHRQGKLPAPVEVSPHIQGDFRPLQAFSEFQEIAGQRVERKPVKKAGTSTVPPPPASSGRFWVIVAAAVGIGVVLLLLFWVLRGAGL